MCVAADPSILRQSSARIACMPNRARDWFRQAARDLDQARSSQSEERHEWACFAAHQAAEKALRALHLWLGQEAWGHTRSKLVSELPCDVPPALVEKGRVLDNFYVPARYPNGHPEGAPFEHYGGSRAMRRFDMPVRSLTSSVIRWPGRAEVHEAVRSWAQAERRKHPGLLRLGCFVSYARGDWGVGSDLDLIAIVMDSKNAFHRRSRDWSTEDLPVPADLLVYTRAEWDRLNVTGNAFAGAVQREIIWIDFL